MYKKVSQSKCYIHELDMVVHMSVIPALRRLRKHPHEFKATVGAKERLCVQETNMNHVLHRIL